MIDWLNVAANALWIIGCSILLAAFSYASWAASENKQRISISLRSKGVWRALHTGGILVFSGLAATSNSIVQAILWALLGIILLVNLLWERGS
jgi:uncharacterized membrane protein YtjA (UPF0391 family)